MRERKIQRENTIRRRTHTKKMQKKNKPHENENENGLD